MQMEFQRGALIGSNFFHSRVGELLICCIFGFVEAHWPKYYRNEKVGGNIWNKGNVKRVTASLNRVSSDKKNIDLK